MELGTITFYNAARRQRGRYHERKKYGGYYE